MGVGPDSSTDYLFTGNVMCDGNWLEFTRCLVYRRGDRRVSRTYSIAKNRVGDLVPETLRKTYPVLKHIEPNTRPR
jgi:hypothetical protein